DRGRAAQAPADRGRPASRRPAPVDRAPPRERAARAAQRVEDRPPAGAQDRRARAREARAAPAARQGPAMSMLAPRKTAEHPLRPATRARTPAREDSTA